MLCRRFRTGLFRSEIAGSFVSLSSSVRSGVSPQSFPFRPATTSSGRRCAGDARSTRSQAGSRRPNRQALTTHPALTDRMSTHSPAPINVDFYISRHQNIYHASAIYAGLDMLVRRHAITLSIHRLPPVRVSWTTRVSCACAWPETGTVAAATWLSTCSIRTIGSSPTCWNSATSTSSEATMRQRWPRSIQSCAQRSNRSD